MRRESPMFRFTRRQSGMSLLEVLIALMIFSVGMFALLSLFSYATVTLKSNEDYLIARQLAREAMESVFGARNSASYSWAAVRNASQGGRFVDGETDITLPGTDGIVNTINSRSEIKTITLPNGRTRTLDEFKREVKITSATEVDDVRKVVITIKYPHGRANASYVLSSYISQWN